MQIQLIKMDNNKEHLSNELNNSKTEDDVMEEPLFEQNEQTLGNKIQNIRDTLKQMNAKILRLRSVTQKRDSTVDNEDVESSINSLMNEAFNNSLHKRVLNICIYSNAIINRVLEKECSQETFEKVIQLLNKIRVVNDKIINLNNKREDLYIQKLALSVKYQEALFNYEQFLEEEKEKDNQTLQSTNPKLAEIKKYNYNLITRINTLKRIITNMVAGSSLYFNEFPAFRRALENNAKLVHLDDFIPKGNES